MNENFPLQFIRFKKVVDKFSLSASQKVLLGETQRINHKQTKTRFVKSKSAPHWREKQVERP